MPEPVAVLVEDDPQQVEVSKDVLSGSGFEVRSFSAITPVLEFLRSTKEHIDLFVLDRRLPVNVGESAADELGDGLLTEIRTSYPDAKIIVFTGFATPRHVRNSMQGAGLMPSHGKHPMDRITVLEKDESLEFKSEVQEYRALLQSLEDIELIPASGAEPLPFDDRRALRRLAFEYWAISVAVRPLGGGLTGAAVWRCELYKAEGHVATVVAKRVRAASALGGLPELLPRVNTTSQTATVSGLMSGDCLNVLQIAGEDPFELMSILKSEPERAVRLVKPLWEALATVNQQQRTITVAEIGAPLEEWGVVRSRLAEHGIDAPSGSLVATVKTGVRHGDLHPGNVLIDNDQPVLIDLDSTVFGAGALDPVTMLVSTLVHPDSPLRGEQWPSTEEIETAFGTAQFGSDHQASAWFKGVLAWSQESRSSEREFWALVLAYAARQLRYGDVVSDDQVRERVLAIARRAAMLLKES